MSSRLQNQSCRPSPVIWGKHCPNWSVGLGSCFFRHDQHLGILGEFHKQKLISLRYKKISKILQNNIFGKSSYPWTSVPHLTTIFPSILLSNLLRFLYLPRLDENNKILAVFYQDAPYTPGMSNALSNCLITHQSKCLE